MLFQCFNFFIQSKFLQRDILQLLNHRYLVEFRDTCSAFRIYEFFEILNNVGINTVLHNPNIENVIMDINSMEPICIYANFPNESLAIDVAKKSCLIRSIIEVYGHSNDVSEVHSKCLKAQKNGVMNSHFSPLKSSKENSWRVTFRRYGRKGKSGLDYEGKRQKLQIFNDFLINLNGDIDLVSPVNDLIYLEDWSSYMNTFRSIESSNHQVLEDYNLGPSQYILGRIIATGPSITNLYNVSSRPFIGTTTMDAISSHLTVIAAAIKPNDLVLDPYCGTGSLLIASASQGANIIGSDYDSFNFGLDVQNSINKNISSCNIDDSSIPNSTKPVSIDIKRSKNIKLGNKGFVRRNNTNQLFKSIYDNFIYYSMQRNCVAFVNTDSINWIPTNDYSNSLSNLTDNEMRVITYGDSNVSLLSSFFELSKIDNPNTTINDDDKFTSTLENKKVYYINNSQFQLRVKLDAILSDPPFGIREKAFGHAQFNSSTSMGDSKRAVITLYHIALCHLKKSGRLVFWFPTSANLSQDDIRIQLKELESMTGVPDIEKQLVLIEAIPQDLHSKLSRWLCIYQRL